MAQAPAAFDLVGLHWRGSGAVRFRTQRADGTWGKWHFSAPEDDLPDRNTAEGRRSHGWHLGNPFWVGRSERIQYRLGGRVTRLRAFFVRSPLLGGTPRHVKPFTENAPPIITRAEWGANESIRRNRENGPEIADNVHLAIVHHTARSWRNGDHGCATGDRRHSGVVARAEDFGDVGRRNSRRRAGASFLMPRVS